MKARSLPSGESLYSVYSRIHTHIYIHIYSRIPPCEQLRKLSRDEESVCEPRSKALGLQSESVLRGNRGGKRKDRRLKCRFRATLKPRKRLSPLLASLSRLLLTLFSYYPAAIHLLQFSPSSTFGIRRFSSSLGTRVFRASSRGPATRPSLPCPRESFDLLSA